MEETLIEDNDEFEITRQYIFLLRRRPDPKNLLKSTLHIDSFTEIPNKYEVEQCKFLEDYSSIEWLNAYIHAFKLRQRFNNDIMQQIFKVTCQCELTAEDLQIHINYMEPSKLTQFLNDATISRRMVEL